jgi:RNA polymerase sigma-70 factor (ECF subfamily)
VRTAAEHDTAELRRLLELALSDDAAFRVLVEPYRAELHAHCYRMLGSFHDAEDALQESMLRSWRGLSSYDPARPLRPWLYRITTNACLDVIAKRPKRTLPIESLPSAEPDQGPGEPVTETPWLEPYPDEALGLQDGYAAPDARYEQRESVELAFIAAVQHLPARQRAVLLLREVLGFSAREVAESLETSVPSVNSALQRARRTLAQRVPDSSQQATLRSLGDVRVRELVGRYVEAWASRDVDGIVAMLVEDATFAMPPFPHWFRGRDAVVAFITSTGHPDMRHLTARANGQPAVAWYTWDPGRHMYAATSLEVLTFDGARVSEVTAFVFPDLFVKLGLPAAISDRSD